MEVQEVSTRVLESMVRQVEVLTAEVAELRRDRDQLAARDRRPQRKKRNWVRSKELLPWQSWMEEYLEVFERTGNRSAAARAVGTTTATVYAYKERCEEFGRRWLEVEKILEERAREGVAR